MLPCSDAPWHTPQNLDDAHLRTLKNEPSNLPSVLQAICDSTSTSSSSRRRRQEEEQRADHPAVSGGGEEDDGMMMAGLRRELFETSVKVFQLPRRKVQASVAAEGAGVVRDVHQSQSGASANDPAEVSTESTSSVHVFLTLTRTLILNLTLNLTLNNPDPNPDPNPLPLTPYP
jgi:hypothetical protein